mmetsp:Transcript_29416/g.67741  ORF Transcript_29416/g.67741 Transcript_29416/m.67741 type:complete len:214 (-) Transcript_29416:98-739(-)
MCHAQVRQRHLGKSCSQHQLRSSRIITEVGLGCWQPVASRFCEGATHDHHLVHKRCEFWMLAKSSRQVCEWCYAHQANFPGFISTHLVDKIQGGQCMEIGTICLRPAILRSHSTHAIFSMYHRHGLQLSFIWFMRSLVNSREPHGDLSLHASQSEQEVGIRPKNSGISMVPRSNCNGLHADLRAAQEVQDGQGIVNAWVSVYDDTSRLWLRHP